MSMEQPSGDSEVQDLDDSTASDEPTGYETDPEGLDSEHPEGEDDEQEEELDGLKVRGKKEAIDRLKGERLMQADYTRKTQEVAEQRRALEAEREQHDQARRFEQQNLDIVADIRAADRQLAQLNQVNLAQLSDADPVQAQKLMVQMQQLQAFRGQAAHALAQRHAQSQQMQQQQAARQMEEGRQVLAREIPGWGPELAAKLVEYGKGRGYSEAQLSSVTSPSFVVDLFRSFQLDQARQKASQRPKPVQDKPVTRVQATSKSRGVTDPDKLSADEWLKWRNSQIRARR
ncbi:MAG: hypothetical protein KGM60_10840 [Comamonadaceae bacterium]|nr:hypothetical protein [Comamonadaceae bacterium]